MTRESYYHNGTVQGDAILAPYSAKAYNRLKDIGLTGSNDYVIDYASNWPNGFNVTRNAATEIAIADGYAVLDGLVVNLGMGPLTKNLSSGLSFGFWARVVIRIVWATNTVSIEVIKGSRTTPPELTQVSGEVYEMSLARIYVPATGDAVQAKYIHDERVFGTSIYHDSLYTTKNIMPNSEFIAPYQGRNNAPALWHTFGSDATVTTEKLVVNEQQRGSRITLTCDNASGMQSGNLRVTGSEDRFVTIQFYLQVQEGEFDIYVDGGSSEYRTVPVTDGFILMIMRFEFTSGSQDLNLYFAGMDTTNVCTIGQVTATVGMIAAPFEPISNEYIPFYTTFDELLNGVTYTVSTEVALGTNKIYPIRTAMLELQVQDTGSSGADVCYTALTDIYLAGGSPSVYHMRNEIGRLGNALSRYSHGVVPFERGASGYANNNYVESLASAEVEPVTSMTVYIKMSGVITQ